MAGIPPPLFVVVAVFFFSLALSHAHIPGDKVTIDELPSSLPESDANTIIRLPSDSHQTHSNEPVKEAQESESSSTIQHVPLKVVAFRPVDHPFRLRSRFPFRCRHHHHHHPHHRFFIPMMRPHRQEIPYGDDMILTSSENADFSDQRMFHGGVRRMPARWVKIHHHHHHHDDEDEHGDGISKLMSRHGDALDKEKFKMHKHHHHHHEDDEKEERFNKHKERRENGSFMKRIRKILDLF